MISFVNFARIASICVGFDLGTLHGYFFQQDFWPNLNFPLEYQIKLVLIIFMFESQLTQMPGPRDIVIYRPHPRAFSIVQKPCGWAHISVQKPRGALGGDGNQSN